MTANQPGGATAEATRLATARATGVATGLSTGLAAGDRGQSGADKSFTHHVDFL